MKFLNLVKFTLVVLFLSVAVHAGAQSDDKALGRLDYQIKVAYVPVSDKDTAKKYYIQMHSLYFGKQASLNIETLPTAQMKDPKFISLKKDTTELSKKAIAGKEDLMDAYKHAAAVPINSPAVLNTSYHVYNSPEFYSVRQSAYNIAVVVNDTLPSIQWKLEPEEKTISGFAVNKAIGQFRGRNYTAWYAKKIPVPAGPWKLSGLPGLILEAYDDTKEIVIQLTALNIPSADEVTIKKPQPEGKVVTQKEFIAAQQKRNDEIGKMLRASSSQTQNTKQFIQVIKLVNMEFKDAR
ncbi:GLPGLI family protein [Mucilaginibacter oryzae]|uniref:GLPGLI family protein n=1 Tax=Mucilaginibacter oryzae TaxID=468058 RepID=A0A316H4C0_9SPHI|nr:GLPGLI family protein [Mucilaginibacter oryzae]PWK73744.1 GLPGLI family protein [Mucilaginibacter oryzae]